MVTKKMYFMHTEETGPVLTHDILNYHPYLFVYIIFLFTFAPQNNRLMKQKNINLSELPEEVTEEGLI